MVADRQQHLGDAQTERVGVQRHAHTGVPTAAGRLAGDVDHDHRHGGGRDDRRAHERPPRPAAQGHDQPDRHDAEHTEHRVVRAGRPDHDHQRPRHQPRPPTASGGPEPVARPQRQPDRQRHGHVVGQEQVPHRRPGELRGGHGEHHRGHTGGERGAGEPAHHHVGGQADGDDRHQQVDVRCHDGVPRQRTQRTQHDQVEPVRTAGHVDPVDPVGGSQAVVGRRRARPADGLEQRQVRPSRRLHGRTVSTTPDPTPGRRSRRPHRARPRRP